MNISQPKLRSEKFGDDDDDYDDDDDDDDDDDNNNTPTDCRHKPEPLLPTSNIILICDMSIRADKTVDLNRPETALMD